MIITIKYDNENKQIKEKNIKVLFNILQDLGYIWASGLEIATKNMSKRQEERLKLLIKKRQTIEIDTKYKSIVVGEENYDLKMNIGDIKELINILKKE